MKRQLRESEAAQFTSPPCKHPLQLDLCSWKEPIQEIVSEGTDSLEVLLAKRALVPSSCILPTPSSKDKHVINHKAGSRASLIGEWKVKGMLAWWFLKNNSPRGNSKNDERPNIEVHPWSISGEECFYNQSRMECKRVKSPSLCQLALGSTVSFHILFYAKAGQFLHQSSSCLVLS